MKRLKGVFPSEPLLLVLLSSFLIRLHPLLLSLPLLPARKLALRSLQRKSRMYNRKNKDCKCHRESIQYQSIHLVVRQRVGNFDTGGKFYEAEDDAYADEDEGCIERESEPQPPLVLGVQTLHVELEADDKRSEKDDEALLNSDTGHVYVLSRGHRRRIVAWGEHRTAGGLHEEGRDVEPHEPFPNANCLEAPYFLIGVVCPNESAGGHICVCVNPQRCEQEEKGANDGEGLRLLVAGCDSSDDEGDEFPSHPHNHDPAEAFSVKNGEANVSDCEEAEKSRKGDGCGKGGIV